MQQVAENELYTKKKEAEGIAAMVEAERLVLEHPHEAPGRELLGISISDKIPLQG
ncbi:hypothetical protein L484_009125 [Morus notabilis]|uniref:Uncharacterized protein n=1 Tax=Morus notabilis TaxID=981085 RepID=W9RU32_9ROSA|nr:hypothetical protein L484_009125 [Morus notabilis]